MSDFLCRSCGGVIRSDCPARVNAEYSREPNPCVPVAADEIERLRARVAELEAAQEWRPIESAPRDGTVIDVTWPNEFGLHRVAWWPSECSWWRDFINGEELTKDLCGWKPLPAPPKVAT